MYDVFMYNIVPTFYKKVAYVFQNILYTFILEINNTVQRFGTAN